MALFKRKRSLIKVRPVREDSAVIGKFNQRMSGLSRKKASIILLALAVIAFVIAAVNIVGVVSKIKEFI